MSKSVLAALGVILLIGVLAIIGGRMGFALGFAVAVLWLVFPSTYSFAIGHILILPIIPEPIPPLFAIAVEGSLIAVLVGPLVRRDESLRQIGIVAATAIGFVLLSWGMSVLSNTLWFLASGILVACGVSVYILYRFEVVTTRYYWEETRG